MSVTTYIGPLWELFGHLFSDTRPAKSKRKFPTFPYGQDGKKKTFQSKDVDLGDPEVVEDVLVCGVVDNLWESHWIGTVLVHPRVQGSEILVGNVFPFGGFGIESGGASASAEEGIAWL